VKAFWGRVVKKIADQSVSIVSLIVSLSFMSYDVFIRQVDVPVGVMLSAVGQSSVMEVRLFVIGAVLFAAVVGVAVFREVRS